MLTIQLNKVTTSDIPLARADISDEISNAWPHHRTFKLYDTDIVCSSRDERVWVPDQHIEDGTDWDEWLPKLLSWTQTGDEVSQVTGWVIGSARNYLSGEPRDSASHVSGHAVDMTPIWDEINIVDPDGASPALAWNVLTLTFLLPYKSEVLSWVVEGDHIHFSNNGDPLYKPDNIVLVATTLSSAYRVAEFSASPWFHKLINKAYGLIDENECVAFAPLEDPGELKIYLGDE